MDTYMDYYGYYVIKDTTRSLLMLEGPSPSPYYMD